MSTVVTGANGFVGGNLVRALLQQGRQVRGLRWGDSHSLNGLELESAEVDIRDTEALRRALCGAETVYHLAGLISIAGSRGGQVFQVNVEGTRNLVEACLANGVRRLVHFCSVHGFDLSPRHGELVESSPLAGPNACAYDRSKALGYQEVMQGVQRGLNACIVHPSGILGPNDFGPSFSGQALVEMFRGALPAVVRGGFDWVDVRDVVEAAIRIEKKGSSGENYIVSGHYKGCLELAAAAAQESGVKRPRMALPRGLAAAAIPFAVLRAKLTGKQRLLTLEGLRSLGANPRMSHAKATREFGYQPRPFQETMQASYAWFKDAGYL